LKKVVVSIFISFLLASPCQASDQLTVSRATNGDTIQPSDGEKVHPTGADTPDSSLQGKGMNLGYDIQEKGKYGRTLTYALLEEGPFINSEIMKSGYAQVITVPPDVKYQESFVSLGKDAKEQEIGSLRDAVEANLNRLRPNLDIEDATGRGNVRVVKAKIGVEYKVSENSTVGVEAIRGIHDARDASGWGHSVKDEKAAQVKYKILF
jgi:hypothetical protein